MTRAHQIDIFTKREVIQNRLQPLLLILGDVTSPLERDGVISSYQDGIVEILLPKAAMNDTGLLKVR